MTGAIHYPAGSTPCFPEETIVQPDNQVPIPHPDIIAQSGRGTFKHEAMMPADFQERLKRAIGASMTMTPRQQKRLSEMLGF